jgi:hypothetical protein
LARLIEKTKPKLETCSERYRRIRNSTESNREETTEFQRPGFDCDVELWIVAQLWFPLSIDYGSLRVRHELLRICGEKRGQRITSSFADRQPQSS